MVDRWKTKCRAVCPNCGRRMYRNGRSAGRQRYRCNYCGCEKQFAARKRVAPAARAPLNKGKTPKHTSIVTIRPECIGCHRVMKQSGSAKYLRWECRRCDVATRQVCSGGLRGARKRGIAAHRYDPNRPCKRCGHPMVVGNKGVRVDRRRPQGSYSYQNYWCANCCARTPKQKAAAAREHMRHLPCCVECKSLMRRCGEYKGVPRFICDKCGVCIPHRMFRQRAAHLASCVECGNRMRKACQTHLKCTTCGIYVAFHRKPRSNARRRNDGRELLTFIESLLPSNLPQYVRDDARQEIATAVILKKVRRKNLNPQTVRPFVRAAFGLNDEHRFLFLDQPCAGAGSSTYGELMEG